MGGIKISRKQTENRTLATLADRLVDESRCRDIVARGMVLSTFILDVGVSVCGCQCHLSFIGPAELPDF